MTEDLSGLDLVGLLGLLKPVPEPEPVSLLPQTAGWLVVGALLLALIGCLLWKARSHFRANAYRRQALSEVARCNDDPARLAKILRRTALAAYCREEVAQLHGPEWLAFLDKCYGGNDFSSGAGRIVARVPYQDVPPDPAVTKLVEGWIKGHQRSSRKNEQGAK